MLTELRTAAAGALSVSVMGPKEISQIGVIGTGVQARYQLEMLKVNTFLKVFLILTQYCEIRIIEGKIGFSLRIRSIAPKHIIF